MPFHAVLGQAVSGFLGGSGGELLGDVLGAVAGGGQVASSEEGTAYSWTAGATTFSRLTDGRIEVVKKDGTIKRYRPYRPVVVPRRWSMRSMRRVARALKSQRKVAIEIVKMTGGFPGARARSSPFKARTRRK